MTGIINERALRLANPESARNGVVLVLIFLYLNFQQSRYLLILSGIIEVRYLIPEVDNHHQIGS